MFCEDFPPAKQARLHRADGYREDVCRGLEGVTFEVDQHDGRSKLGLEGGERFVDLRSELYRFELIT